MRPKPELGQTRTGSLVEAFVNILVGIGAAFVAQIIIFGGYGIHVSWVQNAEMTGWFTVVSLVRQFALRRMFNRWTITHEPVTTNTYQRKLPTPVNRSIR